MADERDGAAPRQGERTSLGLLGLLTLCFGVWALVFLPRLGNAHFGDIEFSGWSGPMGHRLLTGDRPYIDYVLPIPPGSFAVLAALETLIGEQRLLTELSLNAALNLGMAWLGYYLVRPFTAPRNAVLVAFTTLITLGYLNKECAYDHTAQIVAWSSFVVGARALLATGARRRRLWFWTGVAASGTLLFKQSTALGAVAGWSGGVAYLALVEWRSGQRDRLGPLGRDAWALAGGVLVGLWAVWGGLVAMGTTASAFFQAAFVDASVLKGGAGLLLRNVFVYLFVYPSYPGSLFFIAGLSLLALVLVKRRGALSLGDEPTRPSPYSWFDRVFLPLAIAGCFVGGAAILRYGPPGYPVDWLVHFDRLKQVPTFGLVLAALFFVAHLVPTTPADAGASVAADPVRTGHALNALWLAALLCTILHNTSAPEFRPFYDNNPIIPLSLLALFVALDRAGARWLQAVAVLCIVASLGGNRFYRSMIATIDAPAETHWAGMKLSPSVSVMNDVAMRVRELTDPDDTVLVLPEDVQLASQIGRPRPSLMGAIVFVDQYAPRLVDDDIARLEEHPPKVIVIHPRDSRDWQRFFRIWSGASGAESIIQHAISYMIPARYRLDGSYRTSFLWRPADLEIYVREDGPGADVEKGSAVGAPPPGSDQGEP